MKIIFTQITILYFFTFFPSVIFSQKYIPGNTYYDPTGYVEYRAGNLPIIISAPHGGGLEPNTIPDRLCTGCVYEKDGWTKPIAEGMYKAFFEQTGCYPHVIINLLHRKKYDANRDIGDAANGNITVEQSWYAYHRFIDSAKSKIVNDFGRGLFLDIHGHGHTIQRIELGYLLNGNELRLSDSSLNTTSKINESSIKGLVSSNILNVSHSELLRGAYSFGELLDNVNFLSVPSQTIPFPAIGESYFDGGYNTQRHGSRDNNIGIDAIQLELGWDIRNDSAIREMLIDSLTRISNQYINRYYNNKYLNNLCNLKLSNFDNSISNHNFKIYPNPVDDYLNIESNIYQFEINIYNYLEQKLYSEIFTGKNINVNFLSSGLYLLQLKKDNIVLSTMKFIKN